MTGGIREKLNEAPPWLAYTVVGLVVVAAVGIVVWSTSQPDPTTGGDRHYLCTNCKHGFTVGSAEAQAMLEEAARANPGQVAKTKCPACGEYACVVALKCPNCDTYFQIPERQAGMPAQGWRDECPKCGYSTQREQAVKIVLKQKKEGTYDPDKTPPMVLEAVEEYEREHGQ